MRYKAIALTAAISGFAATAALAADLAPLVSPAELEGALAGAETPQILDIRGDAYADGHIAGALSAPYGLFRGPEDNPGAVVPADQLETTYETLGLSPDAPVVIVAQGDTDTDFGAAARVYWTLKSSGFTELSILNGGSQAWVNSGLPLSKDAVTPEPTELDITWNDAWTAETAEVADVVDGGHEALLLDARPAAFFEGKKAHGAAAKPGTLPGAQNYAYTQFFQSGATAIGQISDVQALKASLGVTEGEEIVSFCNTGHWAATNWFALSEMAGIENVKLYPGSMVEYSQTGRDMQNSPGLFKNLLNQVTGGN
ncbi:sulfurtransferase [Salipiger mangrovisoli]|uniref:Sulfurtransferase n=1 Tax=Salipiger mangrovisoli TaxID=2865933 RepID=A0ABR9X3X9_9RHOB|nr:rhodanese-like domain-containing protein [Salipiger mangrovisoli]MBE9638210.1 sulfurtransferase [Salipiger mangrovisoli]